VVNLGKISVHVRFTTAVLERGVWFLSTQPEEAVINETLAAINAAARPIAQITV
jgi:hypothetical protein